MSESNVAALTDSTGVMLIGHGTRDAAGTAEFFQLGERLADRLAPLPLESCLLEFQRPTIAEAWQSLVDHGVERIHVAPLLLFAAGHAKQDIPDALAECQTRTPKVSFDQSRPISRHPAVIDLVVARIGQALEQCAANSLDSTALVMVGRGNRDPCAQADMKVLTEVVAHRFRFRCATTAFYAMAPPSLADVLAELAGSGEIRTILVQPHLLFAGRLYQAICRQVAEAASRFPQVRFCTTDYLGPQPEIAAAIAERIRQIESVRQA